MTQRTGALVMFERLGQPLGHKSPIRSNFRAPTYDRFLVLALPGSNPRVQKKLAAIAAQPGNGQAEVQEKNKGF